MPEILLCGAEGEQFLHVNALDQFGADDKRRGSVKLIAGEQMFRQFATGYADFWVHFRVTPTETDTNSSPEPGVLMEIHGNANLLARITSLTARSRDQNNTVDLRLDAATNSSGVMDAGPVD